jgi:outer membrane protein TolC
VGFEVGVATKLLVWHARALLKHTQALISHAEGRVGASRRSVDLALIQYREDLVDYQRVFDSQRSLAQQQDRFTATQGSVTLNLIALYKALGGGWQIRAGKDFLPEQTKEAMQSRTNWGDLLSQEGLDEPTSEKTRWWWPDW